MEILQKNSFGDATIVSVECTYESILSALLYYDESSCYYRVSTFQIVLAETNRTIVLRHSDYSGFMFAIISENPFFEWQNILEIPHYYKGHCNQYAVGLLNYILKRLKIENKKPVNFQLNEDEGTIYPTFEMSDISIKRGRGNMANFWLLLP